jgi:AraC-like DNA-binding protein
VTDVLSEVLAVTRLKGTVYFSADLRAPWGIALPQRPRSPFYMVARGRCTITIDSRASSTAALGPGDFAILPGGTAHALTSSAGTAVIPLAQFVAHHPMDEHGHVNALEGKGPTTTLIGGFFELERAPEPLVSILPTMIHLRADDSEAAVWLEPTLRAIAREAEQVLPGRDVVLNRLADVVFVKAVRTHLLRISTTDGAAPPSWLRGLSDPRIARALAEIHRAPEKSWTLAQLASQAAMSRTAFAHRFRALVGRSPVSYLATWRMQKAAYLLETRALSIAQVAERVGYTSELAFAKAFRRLIGSPPGAYAREHAKS